MATPVDRNRKSILFLALGLGLAALPGCHSTGSGWGLRRAPGTVPYAAARPAYGPAARKPLFLRGYAGYNYTPELRPPYVGLKHNDSVKDGRVLR